MACLNPASGGLRDFSSESSEFPFVCNETSGEPQAPEWYKRKVPEKGPYHRSTKSIDMLETTTPGGHELTRLICL